MLSGLVYSVQSGSYRRFRAGQVKNACFGVEQASHGRRLALLLPKRWHGEERDLESIWNSDI